MYLYAYIVELPFADASLAPSLSLAWPKLRLIILMDLFELFIVRCIIETIKTNLFINENC
jgi:hypothetical protein